MVSELFYKIVPGSLYTENWGIIQPRVTWCGANFVQPTTLNFQCDFKCKTFCARYDVGNLIQYVKNRPTP